MEAGESSAGADRYSARHGFAAVSLSHALERPRGDPPGRPRPRLPRPRHGRGARGRGQGPAARAVPLAAAVGGREPALLQLVRPARPARPERLPDVRAPHGAARVLTGLYALPMRSRTPAALVVLAVAFGALGIAGCGADDSAGDPIPKSTPDLTVPAGADALAGGTNATSSTPTTSTSTTGTNTTGTTTAPAAGGGTTTSAAPAAPAQTQAPSAGTGAAGGTGGGTGGTGGGTGGTGGGTGGTGNGNGGFNEFCQQNPGACPG